MGKVKARAAISRGCQMAKWALEENNISLAKDRETLMNKDTVGSR